MFFVYSFSNLLISALFLISLQGVLEYTKRFTVSKATTEHFIQENTDNYEKRPKITDGFKKKRAKTGRRVRQFLVSHLRKRNNHPAETVFTVLMSAAKVKDLQGWKHTFV